MGSQAAIKVGVQRLQQAGHMGLDNHVRRAPELLCLYSQVLARRLPNLSAGSHGWWMDPACSRAVMWVTQATTASKKYVSTCEIRFRKVPILRVFPP